VTLDAAFTNLGTLDTDRLILRQMQMIDVDDIFALKSDLKVTTGYGQEPHRSIEETRGWVQRSLINYEVRDAIIWAITVKGEDAAIGECCFWNFNANFRCAEIGYELHPAYWHKGIMAEALAAVLTYGFQELELHRIEANPLGTNEASQRLLLSLGFRHEGTLRQRHFFRGRYEDQLYFGLLADEWAKRTTQPRT
jgi:ribosomal-protein-alanine N-acetyltransferase